MKLILTGMRDLVEHEDYYLNEKGLITFTARYLLQRGYCCGSGCRHCPYNYENVPDPVRTELIKRKNETGNKSN